MRIKRTAKYKARKPEVVLFPQGVFNCILWTWCIVALCYTISTRWTGVNNWFTRLLMCMLSGRSLVFSLQVCNCNMNGGSHTHTFVALWLSLSHAAMHPDSPETVLPSHSSERVTHSRQVLSPYLSAAGAQMFLCLVVWECEPVIN